MADDVLICTGSHPRLPFVPLHVGFQGAKGPIHAPDNVPLDVAIIPGRLEGVVRPTDTVAVVGSSHSAVLCIRNLDNLPHSR